MQVLTHTNQLCYGAYMAKESIYTPQQEVLYMEKSMINKGAVFYENGTWSFLTKTVNCNTYTIEYEKNRIFLY